jgi:hypothetical protein
LGVDVWAAPHPSQKFTMLKNLKMQKIRVFNGILTNGKAKHAFGVET